MYTTIRVISPKYKKELDKFLADNKDKKEGMFGYTGLKPRGDKTYITKESLNRIMWELTAYTKQVATATAQYGSFGLVNTNGKPNQTLGQAGIGGPMLKLAYNAILAEYTNEDNEILNSQ